MFEDFIRERITELRMRKNVSERCMSLDMGRSEGYINHISSGKAMPSMSEFFEICRYFGITPYEFFNENMKYPEKIHKIIKGINKLNEKDTELIINLIESYKENNKRYFIKIIIKITAIVVSDGFHDLLYAQGTLAQQISSLLQFTFL